MAIGYAAIMTKTIYIYDSLNSKLLYTHHQIYLEKLYRFYFHERQQIRFPTVQLQPNNNDCGVFAIAFAVSFFSLQPDKVMYNHLLMRQHLTTMFQFNKIEHFPRIIRPRDPEQILHQINYKKEKKYSQKTTKILSEKRRRTFQKLQETLNYKKPIQDNVKNSNNIGLNLKI